MGYVITLISGSGSLRPHVHGKHRWQINAHINAVPPLLTEDALIKKDKIRIRSKKIVFSVGTIKKRKH